MFFDSVPVQQENNSFAEFEDWLQNYPVGERLEILIEGITGSENIPYGKLEDQSKVLFYGPVTIGTRVTEYIFSHSILLRMDSAADEFSLLCSPYQIEQSIEFTVHTINTEQSFIEGHVDQDTETCIRVYPPPETRRASFEIGQRYNGVIRAIEENDGQLILTCSPEGYIPLLDSSSSDSSSEEDP